jgi:hypothetical protein
MADGHSRGSRGSWIAVLLLVLGVVALGFAMPLSSVWLGVVGGVLVLAGVVVGLRVGIMEDAH